VYTPLIFAESGSYPFQIFPLRTSLVKPFGLRQGLSLKQKVFNYRYNNRKKVPVLGELVRGSPAFFSFFVATKKTFKTKPVISDSSSDF
jgi:hypothetical protein